MDKIKSVLYTILGTAITGFAVSVFLTPNKIAAIGGSFFVKESLEKMGE